MFEWIIFAIIFGLFTVFSSLILPWINKSRIEDLERQIRKLNELVLNGVPKIEAEEKHSPPVEKKPDLIENLKGVEEQVKSETFASQRLIEKPVEPKTKPETKPKIGFEQQFGARLPVWIGGIALALAGFFLVKYSIENNLISPTVRVILGGMFGIGLLYASSWVRSKPDFANGARISQSMTGAGIAVLYLVSYASTRLYDILPIFMGFVAMGAVTATALVLSLRHGAAIALLGMAGGFLTPALLSSGGGNAFALFIYLYFTASGLMIVVRKTKLWWLSIPTIIASLLWVIVWLFSSYESGDSIYLFLFLIGIASTIVISSKNQYEQDGGGTKAGVFKLTSILNYIGLGGTLMIMGLIGGYTEFGTLEWGLFFILALGGIGLAYFNDKLYGFVPWVCMAVNAVMLFSWDKLDYSTFATIGVFASVYLASGYLLMFRSRSPILWGGLTGTTSISYYLLAYYKPHNTTYFADLPLFWGVLAFILAALAVYVLFQIHDKLRDYIYRNHLYAIFTVTATTFTSLALFIELDREFLSVAMAVQMLAIVWINSRVSISALRPIIGIVACIFAFLLIPQIILMIQLTAYSLVEAKLYMQNSVPIVSFPIFQLGLPSVLFIVSSYLLRKQNDNRLVKCFEVSAIALFAVMGYYLTRNTMHPDQNVLFVKAAFFERGVITNILFIYGLACMFGGRIFARSAFIKSGMVLCAVAMFRIVYFDMFMYNPLFTYEQIKGVVIFNGLLLPFGIPLIWSYLTRRELSVGGRNKLAGWTGGFTLAILFALVSMNVRHIFHGEFLREGVTTNAEIYSYSAAWLLLGIMLLFAGLIKKDKMLRYASLSVILFTVAKVFLYDASELEGLFRVFSFLGLGFSLIGLSYFYTRFVFGVDRKGD